MAANEGSQCSADEFSKDEGFPVSYGSEVFDNFEGENEFDEEHHREVMADEGVADWTLERERQKFKFRKQQRIKNKDVGFLMRVRSRIDFKSDEDQIKYVKSKLKDLAHNY